MTTSTPDSRRHARLPLPAMYTSVSVRRDGAAAVSLLGHAYDVSASGLRVELDEPLTPGENVEISVELPGPTSVAASGRAVWVHSAEDDPAARRCAIELTGFVTPGDEQRLRRFLERGGTSSRPPRERTAVRCTTMWADEQDVLRSDRATIVLIGLRGSGKTNVGRAAADAMDVAFIDLDEVVLAAFPEETVREIWASHGEEAWRTVEAIAFDAVFDLAAPPGVVALGGGAPMIAELRARLEQERASGRAFVVYLHCSTDTLEARLGTEPGDRPSLTGGAIGDETHIVRERREPTFLGLADAVVEADGDPETVMRSVLEAAYGP